MGSSEIEFTLSPVEEKPDRRYKKGSKYDPILDQFLNGSDSLVEVTVGDKQANYLSTQINKRIESRGLSNVRVSTVNNVLYLERV